MNTNELLASWSMMPLEEIEARLQAGTDDEAIEQFFGADEAAELHEAAQAPQPKGGREAVVLLPGIMGRP